MTRNREILERNYARAAEQIIACLCKGKDVAYLTLGDPAIYSTYIYIHRMVREQGYPAEMINGVPSFCAAAANWGKPCRPGTAASYSSVFLFYRRGSGLSGNEGINESGFPAAGGKEAFRGTGDGRR